MFARAGTLLLLTLVSTAPALAGDRTGAQAIALRDYTAAEKTLVAERRIFPTRPELMLNLAAVYARTDRPAAARALYANVLARPAAAMDMSSGAVVSSHDVARLGLRQLSGDGAGLLASR